VLKRTSLSPANTYMAPSVYTLELVQDEPLVGAAFLPVCERAGGWLGLRVRCGLAWVVLDPL